MKLYKNFDHAKHVKEGVQALKLTLKNNEFAQEISHFPNLTELYLEGECQNFYLHPLAWPKIRVLSIKWPFFAGDLSCLFDLPHLENLKIIQTPMDSFTLPMGHTLAPLKSLTIKDCGMKSLPEEFSMIWQLTELNLSGNQLTKIPSSFIDLKNLRRLNLDSNNFSNFPDAIKKMAALSHLSIDHNQFSEEEKERIQREFHIWPN